MPRRSLRPFRRLHLENLEGRIQPATLQPLRVALISDAVSQAAEIEAAVAKGVIAVDFNAATATLDGLVGQLQSVSVAHGGARIGQLGLVAHGSAGAITLGPLDTLDRNDTATNSPTWDRLRNVLTPNARIDLYACDVAANRDGKMFVNQLARRTGAAVYSSTDAVGTGRGADLVWEYNSAVRGRAPLFQIRELKRISGLVLEDAYEPNNNKIQSDVGPANLGVITSNKSLNNMYLAGGTEDWFRFETSGVSTTANYVRLDLNNDNGNLDLYVYEQNGTTEVGSDGGGWDTQEVSLAGKPAGIYYVRVVGVGGAGNQNYTLQILPPAAASDDLYETNNTKADADGPTSPANLGLLTAAKHLPNLVSYGNEDWFRFETAGVSTIANYVRLDLINGNGNLDLFVYEQNGTTEVGSDGGGWDTQEVSLTGKPAGTYYVCVRGAGYNIGNAAYSLQIVAPSAAPDDPYETNNNKIDADRAPGLFSPNLGQIAGSRTLSNLVVNGNEDWFRFSLASQATDDDLVRIDLKNQDGNLDLYVYKSNGVTEVGSDGGGWDTQQVSLAGQGAGVYYVRVKGAGYNVGNASYDLQIIAPGSGLSIEPVTVMEGDGGTVNAVFTVSRSNGSTPFTVSYATDDGTATLAGNDYVFTAGTLNFNANDMSKTFSVPVRGDFASEADEIFFVNLSNPTNGVELNQSQAIGTILNDDNAGTIQFSSPTYSVKETAGIAVIKVTRTGGFDGPVTIDYTTSDGSAEKPGDYTLTSGTLEFKHGEISKSFTVSIINDGNPEQAETVNLILSNPNGGVELGDLSTAELTIHDPPGTLQFATSAYSVNEDDITGLATITVRRLGGAEGAVTVRYATVNKTAVAPSDYAAETGSVTFEDGETTKTFDIKIERDTVFETNEVLTLTLSNPSVGARLGALRTATLTILNDDDLMTPGSIVAGAGNSGVVKVLDGKTGAIKATIQAFQLGYKAGVRVATGDVNGDGTADIIAAPGPNGSDTVRVFDGTTGTKFTGNLGEFAHELPLTAGVYVAAGDLNGDGKAEIIVGPGGGAGPLVKVFDGETRTFLRDIDAFSGANHGVTLAVGDVSGDTRPEIIIGAGPGGPGSFKVYDWASDSLGNAISAFAGVTGGVTVATRAVAGGKDEIIVASGSGGAPIVKRFNGSTGSEIPSLIPAPYAPTFRGGVTVAAGDIDGDGILELITGAGPGPTQKLKVFDFATGQLLKQYAPFGTAATNGVFVAVAK